ncbi:LysR family transcriptional regulator [Shewanella litorisediminis]|uniref:LysR family transcriptional regulator n=1 Tax=Shewanella litorisediminis TaxID=1173586 RepID=A0ABX7FYL1_9GAMM|nr:LysR family transcriptional regulator [Shewanella litorisediminis]MCL2919277.1 LysR family transcriptional regulator [Shewanella litorisediminis]QRH00132.1 LysR family transcriptional regulator [Shewanella litorisediminis]
MFRAKSTLEQWRILQAVVDHGGYAQAATALNKSQSSLNHAVAKLQHQLGVELLEVRGRKAYLTPRGEVLLRRSRYITQSVMELEQLATNLERGWEPSLTIAREIIYPMDKLIAAINAFLPNARGTRVSVIDSVLNGTHELVEENKVDIALCGGNPPKGHLAQPLCVTEMILVCHPSNPLAAEPKIHDDKFLAQQLQIVIRDTAAKTNKDMGWLKAEQRWTVSNFHEAKAILCSGSGFCWLPKELVEKELASGELVRLYLTGSESRKVPINLVVPNRDDQGPAGEALELLILAQHGISCQRQ